MQVPRTGVCLLFVFLAFQNPLKAASDEAENPHPQGVQQDANIHPGLIARDIWSDQKAIWTIPIHMNAHQWLTLAGPIAGVTAGLIATDEKSMKLLPNSQGQIRWCNGISVVGSGYSLAGFSLGTMLMGKLYKQPSVASLGRGSAEALADAAIVSLTIKGATARERPDENDGKGRFWKGGDSFPSGHSMGSWAVAASIARRRDCPRWAAILSYGTAGAVSFARWGATRHFPSDVVVGSVFGWFIGNRVAHRQP